jgi:hypothetical protein
LLGLLEAARCDAVLLGRPIGAGGALKCAES